MPSIILMCIGSINLPSPRAQLGTTRTLRGWYTRGGGDFWGAMKVCSVEGCTRKVIARGYCIAHYQRWKFGRDMTRPINRNPSGSQNPNWRGGRIVSDGRVLIYSPGHPYPNINPCYVFRYRLVVEEAVGRYLLPKEIVHHKNRITDDDRLDNLEVTDRVEHGRIHMTMRMNGRWSILFDACIRCGKTLFKHHTKGRCYNCYLKYLSESKRQLRSVKK